MLASVGQTSTIESSANSISADTVVVLSGVGSFDSGVARLKAAGWYDVLAGPSATNPVLGICLGMQMLGERSEEGEATGLARLPLSFQRIVASDRPDEDLRLPHMGWNTVEWRDNHVGLVDVDAHQRFYFVHSYASIDVDLPAVAGTSIYGSTFVSAIWTDRTVGFQFHPEKSHTYGRNLILKAIEHLGQS